MLIETVYDRVAAVRYALRWAYARNPRFYDFEDIGGDCTNYISQCLYAGCGVMNYSQNNGWYYINSDNRSPSWTGVVFLREFLLTNLGAGVYGVEAALQDLSVGDVIQLRNSDGVIYHSLFVTFIANTFNGIVTADNIFVSAHSYDVRNRRLSRYGYAEFLPIHIVGARREIF